MHGRDFQPMQHSSLETSLSPTCHDILTGAMSVYYVTHTCIRSPFNQVYKNLSPHACSWPTQILHGENPQSLYRTDPGHIHTLLRYSNLPQDLIGFLLCASGEVVQLELGLTRQIFEAPLILQEVVTDPWLKHTWLAMHQANIHLMVDIPDFFLPHPKQR